MPKKLDILESHTMRFLLQGEARKKLIAHFQEIFPVREKNNVVEVEFAMSQEENFYDLLDQFAKENGYSFPPRDEKFTFADLKVGEMFIQFPSNAGKKGDGSFLKPHPVFEKIYPTNNGENAKQTSTSKSFVTFLPSVRVLKVY